MIRGGVFIGVDQTGGGLETLHDAAQSANAMRDWAVRQGGLKSQLAVTITDAEKANGQRRSVTRSGVLAAVNKLIDANVDVLIIYFSGHGVTTGYQRDDQWLMSGAPRDPNDAVSVADTVACAQLGPVPYICIISDACRSPAAGALAVDGGTVFPNLSEPGQPRRPVDVFYSCRSGQTAKEVATNAQAIKMRSWYTQELLAVLNGTSPEFFRATIAGDYQYLWPRDLSAYFQSKVFQDRKRAFVTKAKLIALDQNPDAAIVSEGAEYEWLARRDAPSPPRSRELPGDQRQADSGPDDDLGEPFELGLAGLDFRAGAGLWIREPDEPSEDDLEDWLDVGYDAAPPEPPGMQGIEERFGALVPSGTINEQWDLSRVAQRLFEYAATDSASFPSAMEAALRAPAGGTEELVETIRLLSVDEPNLAEFPTRCGLVVRGASLVEVQAVGQQSAVELVAPDRVACGIESGTSTVLITFDHDALAAVPVIAGFVATLTFSEQRLVDIAYEPADDTQLSTQFDKRRSGIRAMRAVAASATLHSQFRFDGMDIEAMIAAMSYGANIDPTLALYTAYGLHKLQKTEMLEVIAGRLRATLGDGFYDVELMLGNLDSRLNPGGQPSTVGFAPSLSAGWSLLTAYPVHNGTGLHALRHKTIQTSPWTLFSGNALQSLERGPA